MQNIDKSYWESRWQQGQTGWDIGYASPALMSYMESYPDKSAKILIPGCGQAYEAEALVKLGFQHIHLVDISENAVFILQEKFKHIPQIKCMCLDFFELKDQYHLILEQTFFCALHPSIRKDYVNQCHQLLYPGGKAAGLLFASYFKEDGPPFGGEINEYRELFGSIFKILKLEPCFNSILPRAGNELFFIMEKN